MTLSLWFWLLMILWLIFGFVWVDAPPAGPRWRPVGGHVLLWVLLALLGYGVFGGPIK
jgi:hypothetical protein